MTGPGAPPFPAGPTQGAGSWSEPHVSHRLFVFRVNFVAAKPVQLLSLPPQQLPTGRSFWLLPQSVPG